jgi:tetratricopeptide (TPR) repeat protein
MNRFVRIVSLALGLAIVGIALRAAAQTSADVPGDAARAGAVPATGPDLAQPSAQPEQRTAGSGERAGEPTELPIAETAPAPGAEKPIAAPGPLPATAASLWKLAEPKPERSAQLEQIAQQADRQTRHAFELAGRGAFFAARAECLAALRLLAEGLDTEQKTNVHVRALAAAVTAMKESDDFLPRPSQFEAETDAAAIIATHVTPVLKAEVETATPLAARKCYLTFAQEQLALAADREVAGSMALRALGKVYYALGHKKGLAPPATESKAVVFFQAALLANRNNFLAANDLGVLLAQTGDYANACRALEYSVSIYPQSAAWHNLAVVYRQLDQVAAADRADRQAASRQRLELARRPTGPAGHPAVQWLDGQSFARTSATPPDVRPATPSPPAAAPKGPPLAAAQQQGPAPTPAAAQREAWAAGPCQR